MDAGGDERAASAGEALSMDEGLSSAALWGFGAGRSPAISEGDINSVSPGGSPVIVGTSPAGEAGGEIKQLGIAPNWRPRGRLEPSAEVGAEASTRPLGVDRRAQLAGQAQQEAASITIRVGRRIAVPQASRTASEIGVTVLQTDRDRVALPEGADLDGGRDAAQPHEAIGPDTDAVAPAQFVVEQVVGVAEPALDHARGRQLLKPEDDLMIAAPIAAGAHERGGRILGAPMHRAEAIFADLPRQAGAAWIGIEALAV